MQDFCENSRKRVTSIDNRGKKDIITNGLIWKNSLPNTI